MIRILIVDDDPTQTRTLCALLRRHLGAQCVEAATWSAGMELFRTNPFDVVLCDLDLPDSTPPQTVKGVRDFSGTPVVILSGQGDGELVHDAVVSGAADFFVKGTPFELLESRIGILIDRTKPTPELSHRLFENRKELATQPAAAPKPAPSLSFSGITLTEKTLFWIINLATLVGIFWIKLNFVSVTAFEAYKVANEARRTEVVVGLRDVNQTLIRIDEKMKHDGQQDSLIKDHEDRLRRIEQK